MKSPKVTPQQEKFCQLIAVGLNQSDAYRAAYNIKRAQAKTVHEKASRLAAEGKVKARVDEIRKPIIEEVRYDLRKAMDEAEKAMLLGLMLGQSSAVVAAVQLRSKLNGLLVEERRNERTPLQDLTDEQLGSFRDRIAGETAAIVGVDPDRAGTATTH